MRSPRMAFVLPFFNKKKEMTWYEKEQAEENAAKRREHEIIVAQGQQAALKVLHKMGLTDFEIRLVLSSLCKRYAADVNQL